MLYISSVTCMTRFDRTEKQEARRSKNMRWRASWDPSVHFSVKTGLTQWSMNDPSANLTLEPRWLLLTFSGKKQNTLARYTLRSLETSLLQYLCKRNLATEWNSHPWDRMLFPFPHINAFFLARCRYSVDETSLTPSNEVHFLKWQGKKGEKMTF